MDRHDNISLYTCMKFLKLKDTFKCSILSPFLLDSSFIEMEAIDWHEILPVGATDDETPHGELSTWRSEPFWLSSQLDRSANATDNISVTQPAQKELTRHRSELLELSPRHVAWEQAQRRVLIVYACLIAEREVWRTGAETSHYSLGWFSRQEEINKQQRKWPVSPESLRCCTLRQENEMNALPLGLSLRMLMFYGRVKAPALFYWSLNWDCSPQGSHFLHCQQEDHRLRVLRTKQAGPWNICPSVFYIPLNTLVTLNPQKKRRERVIYEHLSLESQWTYNGMYVHCMEASDTPEALLLLGWFCSMSVRQYLPSIYLDTSKNRIRFTTTRWQLGRQKSLWCFVTMNSSMT